MRDVAAQVGVEQGVGGAGAGELALEISRPMLLGDLGPGAVGADQVAGPLGEDGVRIRLSQKRTVTPSASCSWLRYSVLKRDDRAALGGVR